MARADRQGVNELVHRFIGGVADEMPTIPPDSIVSRTLHSDPAVKIILFGFAPGQELSEHTSARRAMLYFVDGDAEVRLGEETFAAKAGSFAYMPPHLPHSVTARAATRMLLIMVEAGA